MIMLWADLPLYSFPYSDLIPVKKLSKPKPLFNWVWWTKNFANHCWNTILNWLHCGKTVLFLYTTVIVCLIPKVLKKERELEKYTLHFHYNTLIRNPSLRKCFKQWRKVSLWWYKAIHFRNTWRKFWNNLKCYLIISSLKLCITVIAVACSIVILNYWWYKHIFTSP